jgi:predicted transcriptional regulator of viral defense system
LLTRFVDDRQAEGRYVVTRDQAVALGLTDSAARESLRRLEKSGRISKVGDRHGVWAIIPPEYRSAGAPPALWVLDDIMQALQVPYYVGLRSAAELYGATHHAVQVLQVLTPSPILSFRIGRQRVRFNVTRRFDVVPTRMEPRPVAPVQVSTPEATMIDLVRLLRLAGGLNAVGAVLGQMADQAGPGDIAPTLDRMGDRPTAQRLGFLLDQLGLARHATAVERWLSRRPTRVVRLTADAGTPRDERPRTDDRWKIVVNAEFDFSL